MEQQALIPPVEITKPPSYCQYAAGPCDQSFVGLSHTDAIFFFPSEPTVIASAIEEAKSKIASAASGLDVRSWRDLPITGQLLFCQICKASRFARTAVVDVTTLNFNLMFEIGYAIGLGIPVIPIRDSSYVRDKKDFDELGLIDTLGYHDFQNSDELADALTSHIRDAAFSFEHRSINRQQPLYVLKSPVDTDGQIKMLSVLKKSAIHFRIFDPRETARISLQDAVRQVKTSMGVIAHLIDPERSGARVHNARCALISGMAMANGARVLMLQESAVKEPIDYRDVVRSYDRPSRVEPVLVPFIRAVVEELQLHTFVPVTIPLTPLEQLDFGDVAAENEIQALRTYFVPTSQYNEARRGHARLVVGRKGTGKSAVFYGVRDAYWKRQDQLVLDLKPEGHQFTKLREAVLAALPQGVQEHVLTAFWNYLLLSELARKIVADEYSIAHRDRRLAPLHDKLSELIDYEEAVEEGDFSERLLNLVDQIASRTERAGGMSAARVTELVYEKDVKALNETLSEYLATRGGVWLLFDNLDKGWPINDVRAEDILLIKCLLEATRKLERQLARKNVECHAVVFIRNDIFTHLLKGTPDKGKDNFIFLDWMGAESLKEMIRRRIVASVGTEASFDVLWQMFFDSHVGGEESFSYILRRTLMRPRDLIRCLRQCVNVAVNRGHERVMEQDILDAESVFSEDALQEVSFELRDVSPEFADLIYEFIGSRRVDSEAHVKEKLEQAAIPQRSVEEALELLLWFGVLGVHCKGEVEERYSYEYQYGIDRLLREADKPLRFVIHPAFRKALGVT